MQNIIEVLGMNEYRFAQICKKVKKKEKHWKNIFIAFISGGILGVLFQGVSSLLSYAFELQKNDANLISTYILIFITILSTGLGIYDKAAQYLGAGSFIPISGFANSLSSSAMECRSEGLVYGIGSNMFKLAGSVLTYGFVTAYFLAILYYIAEKIGG